MTPIAPYSDVAVDAATRGDVDEVAAIERAAFSDPWSRRSFDELIGNPAVCFLVARHRSPAHRSPAHQGPADRRGPRSVLGYVIAWFAADESEIANLAVAPSSRGRAVGARLLDAALDEAVRRGAATTYLEVRESNAAARRLYASRGFSELGRRRNYYRSPTEDALVLGRPTAAFPTGDNGSVSGPA